MYNLVLMALSISVAAASSHSQIIRRAGDFSHPKGLVSLFSCLWRDRSLLWQMTKRDVTARYRGSFAGLLWSLINPLLLLAVYTFVFGYMTADHKNPASLASLTKFAFELFAGLIVFNFFSECLNRAPGLILGNVNYVKKVVFPLEDFCWMAAGTALFNAAMSFVALLAAFGLASRGLPWTAAFLPVIFLPLLLFTIGFSWFLSALGVYVRDVGQIIGIVMMILMFLSPIFYPNAALPLWVKRLFLINPLTFPVEQVRAVILHGTLPDWNGLVIYGALSLLMAWLGFAWFQKARNGFPDVI